MASPSYGSSLADTLVLLAEVYNNKLGKQLQWGSPDIVELDRNLKDFVAEKKLPHLIGCEALENRFVLLIVVAIVFWIFPQLSGTFDWPSESEP